MATDENGPSMKYRIVIAITIPVTFFSTSIWLILHKSSISFLTAKKLLPTFNEIRVRWKFRCNMHDAILSAWKLTTRKIYVSSIFRGKKEIFNTTRSN